MNRTALPLFALRRPLVVVALMSVTALAFAQQPSLQRGPTPEISGGADASSRIQRAMNLEGLEPSQTGGVMGAAAYVPGVNFDTYNFDDNVTENAGFLFIPPDPIGAAGPDRLVGVVNAGIEARSKAGVLLWRDSLKDFFTNIGAATLGTFCFDPKVVYDEHAGRFVVVALERTDVIDGAAVDASRIHIAVSKTSSPATATAADWWVHSINSKLSNGGIDYWADYPGLEVDEEVVYITMNFFNFKSFAASYDERLFIIQKGLVGGLYGGGAAAVSLYDPYTATGVGGFKTTTMPCQVHGAAGVAPGVGTYLLSYSSLTYGGPGNPEALMLIRVNNPAGAATFVQEFVTISDIENVGGAYGFPALPDAPQMGTATLIEVNDPRALDAVWRNGYIYFTTTINPNLYDPANQGTTTAHVIKLDATGVINSASPAGLISLSAETDVGAEDIAAGTYTYFPCVAVNGSDDVKVGFAGSSSTTYGSAYAAEIDQATFTPNPTAVVRAGVDYYIRTFSPGGAGRNRWGDYTGISVDPADGTTFWMFNQWAMTRGTPTNTPAPVVVEDGRWATAWLSCVQQVDMDWGDAPDPLYPTLSASAGASHTIVPGVFMGALIDAEPDGQPTAAANGDDISGSADEDGLIGANPMIAGQPEQFTIICSVNGILDVWVDYNANGSWLDPGEQVYSGPAIPGLNNVNFVIPIGATPGTSYTRIRFNTAAALPPTGPAADGEVEDYRVVINPPEMDFGDAPDGPYPTLLATNGARHIILPGVFLGIQIDAEADGQPTPLADGDDLNNLADEDGVVWVTPLVTGGLAQMDVTASVAGWVDAWIDFDGSGAWDPLEQIYSGPVNAGLNNIQFGVPIGAVPGLNAYARVRYNLNGPLPVDGQAPDGEVEDYVVLIQQGIDFGDAMDPPYPTLLGAGGAHHFIVPGIRMGNLIDAENDGQPDPNAKGDDNAYLADEDGLIGASLMQAGQPAFYTVTCSVAGNLDVWVDFNANGSWLDPGEQVYSGPAVPGLNNINWVNPAVAAVGFTYSRIRFNTGGPLPPTGPAPDGEVEDYELFMNAPDLDYGDAPDPSYRTLLANNGARHAVIPGVFLGNQVDVEPDGQPDPNATGDDLANLADEDGVTWVTPIIVGLNAKMDVVASANGELDAWIDLNGNGAFDHPAELIYSGPVVAGVNPIVFNVPAATLPGLTFARVRYNVNGHVMTPTGFEPDGEVEDYQVVIDPPQNLDFGDAPDPLYPTLFVNGGAYHTVVPGVMLGNLIDPDPDGQPDPTATGDDLNNLPDEDGVTWLTALVPGKTGQVQIIASVPGWIDLWIDLDGNGTWDPAEELGAGPIPAGLSIGNVNIPGSATPGFTFARVRFNTLGPLLPTGPAIDGEVEDYRVRIDPPELDFGDAPDSYTTLLASNGPRHVINTGVMMGPLIDPEADGQPTPLADGDDGNALADEDGVAFLNPAVAGSVLKLDVTVSVNGWLDLWIDYNQNGVFDHPAELAYSAAVASGVNSISFGIPGGASLGWTYLRARYNLSGALTPSGFAPDGEVEDYRVRILDVTGIPGDTRPLGFEAPSPNPFSNRVTISLALDREETVMVRVYGMDGTLVRTLAQDSFGPGRYELVWDGRNDRGQPVTAGVYFFRMQAGKTSQNQKVLFVR